LRWRAAAKKRQVPSGQNQHHSVGKVFRRELLTKKKTALMIDYGKQTSAGTKSKNDLEGIPESALGSDRCHGFLNRRSVDLCRPDTIRRPFLYGSLDAKAI
jgi:hypothetical protein